jgi:hypothetical protein
MTERSVRSAVFVPPLHDLDRSTGRWEERLARRQIAVGRRADGRPVLMRPDSVLAKAVDQDAVERVVPEAERIGLWLLEGGGGDARRIGDYVLLGVDPDQQSGRRWSVEPVARSIQLLGANGFRLKPNHVYLANDLDLGSARFDIHPSFAANARTASTALRTTARPAEPYPLPEPLGLTDRPRPKVLVLDTGLRAIEDRGQMVPEHEGLRGRVEVHTPWRSSPQVCTVDDDDEPHADGDTLIDVCAGHGTFIAGIIRRICPDAEIHVDGVLSSFGDGDDVTVEEGITRALTRVAPAAFDVVVMSLGCYTSDDRFPPLAAVVRRLADGPRTVVVASAGNNASARPYFPAAIPEVIAVGALDGSRRAWFSNFGGWVDACAPGVEVISTYFCDADDVDDGVATRYQGWAAWNGTSFAAPKVAAAIAQDLYLHGGSAKDAWKRLASHRHARFPDLGVIFDLV